MEQRSPSEFKAQLKDIIQERQKEKEAALQQEVHSVHQEETYSAQENLQAHSRKKFFDENNWNQESRKKYEQVSGGVHQDIVEYERIYNHFSDLYRNYTFILEQIQTSTKEIDSYAESFLSASGEAKEELLKFPSMITALSGIQKNISGIVEKLSSEEFFQMAEIIVEASVRFQKIGNEVLREFAVMKAEKDELKNEIKALRILIEEKLLEQKVDAQGENVEK